MLSNSSAGSAGHAIGYHSKPKDTAGNDGKIVFIEKVSVLYSPKHLTNLLLWTIGFFLVQVFDCRTHFYINWGPLSDLEKCLSSFKQLLAYSVSDVIMDVFILILPLPLIWMLHMPRERKLAVSGIFLLGTLAVIAGTLRMVVFAEILGAGHTQVVLHILGVVVLDDMAVVSLILFWPMVEMGVALVAACLPTLRPLFHDVSVESVIHSVRSKLSLSSLRSTSKSSLTQGDTARRSNDSTRAFASKDVVTNALPEDDEYLETHIMADVGSERSENQLNAHKISIRNDLTQAFERV
ncbi:MAG: hypothetical protein Q9161_002794 [Pseudevernia consocians]